MKALLTHDRLLALFSYSESTGIFSRKLPASNQPAGPVMPRTNGGGYQRIVIDGRFYFVHRLAWFYFYEAWPLRMLDHIDGIKTNNRICNLRECSVSENGHNLHGAARAKSGLRGAYWVAEQQKWKSSICINRKQIFLGFHDSALLANAAYLHAKKTLKLS